MRYYVTTDIHGFYTPLIAALTKAGFFADSAPHKLVILGDLFDRGKEALELQTFLSELLDQDKVILIRGNHEDLFEELVTIDTGLPYRHHVDNGTYDTALQLTGFDPRLALLCTMTSLKQPGIPCSIKKSFLPCWTILKQSTTYLSTAGSPAFRSATAIVVLVTGAMPLRIFGKKPAGSTVWLPFDMPMRMTKPSSVAIGTPLLVTLQSTMPALNSVQMPISAPFTAQASLL